MALVQELAETTKVPAEVSWVVDLQSQGAELVLECRRNLSKGNAVIVRGSQAVLSPPPPQDMDAEYLEGLGYDVDNVIYEVHGECSPWDFFYIWANFFRRCKAPLEVWRTLHQKNPP